MLIAVISLLLAASGPSASCDAHGVYSRVREATGGPRWDGVAEIVSSGTVVTSGMQGTFVRANSLKDGRSSLTMTVNRQQTADVYDGTTNWQRDYSRGVHPLNSPNARAAAITAAYLDRNGPWSPASSDAQIDCLGTREEDGRTFDVFRITPQYGIPADQWVDTKTHLVDRTVVETPTSTIVTNFSDYRPVQGVLVPFRVQTATVGDPTSEEIFSTNSAEIRSQVADDDFRRPPDPTDTRMLATTGAVMVPIAIEAGDVIVNAYINGKGPFPFILDTGGHAILTPEAAAEIGLKTEGAGSSGGGGSGRIGLSYAFVDSLRIGDAEIPNQPFLVIPYDNDFSDRGSKPPLAGILGLELFERFAIRIDYGNTQLTLTPLSTFSYNGNGARAPIVFQEDEPLTTATADQTFGLFGVDTGNSGALIMFEKFLHENGFLRRYAQGSATTGSGTGGKVQLVRHTIGSFSLGGRTLSAPLTYFVLGQKGGAFSSTTEAGNLGYNVLAHFVPTFDYRHGVMYLEAAASEPPPPLNRSGLALSKPSHDAFIVDGVRAGSPAADAGVRAGDVVTAIDGKAAASLGDADVYTIMRQPVGTVITLRLGGKASRTAQITLREMPPA